MEKKSYKSLISLYALFFVAAGMFSPFLPEYFRSRHLSYTQMGFAFSLISIAGVVIPPLWGYITDRYLNKRTSIFVMTTVSALISLGFIFANNFITVLLVLIILLTFRTPIGPVMDAYCLDVINRSDSLNYSKIRLMGSLGFAIATLVMGSVVKQFGVNSVYILLFFTFAGCFVLFYIFSKGEAPVTAAERAERKKGAAAVIKNKKFILFIISFMFCTMASSINGNFIAELVKTTGGNVANLGFLWFFACSFEVIGFTFANKLIKKYGSLNVYLFAVLLYGLKFILDSFTGSYTQVIALQSVKGIAFALMASSSIGYINENVKSEFITSALTISSAVCGGIGGFTGGLLGGFILNGLNAFLLFRIMSLGFICAFILALPLRYMKNSKKLETVKRNNFNS